MRLLFVILFAMLLTGVGVYWVAHEPGYILLAWGSWTVQISLLLFVIASTLSFVILYILLRLLDNLWRAPRRAGKRIAAYRSEKSRKLLIRGLLEYAEGHWRKAEQTLIRSAPYSETSLLNYLSAAYAAQHQRAYDRRDEYLRRAIAGDPKARIAVELSQAQLQLEHQQTEQALATLNHLSEIESSHPYVIHLLAKIYLEKGDWDELARLLPKIRHIANLDPDRFFELETRIISGRMEQIGKKGDTETLKNFWVSIPRKLRQKSALIGQYTHLLMAQHESAEAEKIITHALKREWNEELVTLYGLLRGNDIPHQLKQAEAWLPAHPHSPGLLLTLARLSAGAELWSKARTYYETCIAENPNPDAYLEISELLLNIGEKELSAEQFRKGLAFCVHREWPAPELQTLHKTHAFPITSGINQLPLPPSDYS